MRAWLIAFVLTQVVEIPIYVRGLRGSRLRAIWSRALVGFGASAITHPFVWFVFPMLLEDHDYVVMVLCAEGFAVAIEAIWLAQFGARGPLLLSAIANGASVAVGFVSRWLFGIP
jgi:hypothetical protein